MFFLTESLAQRIFWQKKNGFPLFQKAQVAANCQKPTPENDVGVLKLDLDQMELIETNIEFFQPQKAI